MANKFIIAILVTVIVLASGCAGQPSQTSQGAGPQPSEPITQDSKLTTIGTDFPSGWQLTKSEENPKPGALLSKDVSTFYKRGSEGLIVKSQTYKDAADAKGIYETLQTSLQNTETFSAGDGALVASSGNSLAAAGHKGNLYINVRYANQPDGSYKTRNLIAEKELARNTIRALLA